MFMSSETWSIVSWNVNGEGGYGSVPVSIKFYKQSDLDDECERVEDQNGPMSKI